MTSDPPPQAIPAATVVIFRERPGGGAPELLMLERGAAMAFAGGAMVFPGGRVDPGDRLLAAALPGDAEENAARIAAARECVEECGIAVGIDVASTAVAALRRSLHAGLTIGDALAAHGGRLALDRLIPFARWRPAHRAARVFDTRFYLARLPDDAPAANVDATEHVRLSWITAHDAIAEAEAGRARVIFPTRRNLERLARFDGFAAAVADARAHPIRVITPWEEEQGGVRQLRIPEDLGYPITSQPLDDALRG